MRPRLPRPSTGESPVRAGSRSLDLLEWSELSPQRWAVGTIPRAPLPISFKVPNIRILLGMAQFVTSQWIPQVFPPKVGSQALVYLRVIASPANSPPRPASRSPPKPRPWGGTRAEAGTGLTGRQGSGVQSVRTRPGRGEGAALPRPTGRWDPQSGEPGAARPLPAHSSCGRSCPAGLWGGAGSWALPS